ncbi:MAG: hypothetical protein V4732_00155 [Pseudomonadota bacterium]
MISSFKTIKQCGAFILILAGLVESQTAQATFVMTLDDLSDSAAEIKVFDQRPDAYNGSLPGVFAFSGMVGNFDVNVIAGISQDVNGKRVLTLNNLNATSSSAGSFVLQIEDIFTGRNFFVGNQSYAALTHIEGNTQGSVAFSALHAGTAISRGTLESSFNQTEKTYLHVNTRADINPTYISFLAEITHGTGNNVTNFSASVAPAPVPLPAGIWLFISALGSGFFVRRKQIV